MSKLIKITLIFIVAASVLDMTAAPRRNRKATPKTQTRTSEKDPLDAVLEYYRNVDRNSCGVAQRSNFSFKVVSVISDSEGVFEVFRRDEMYAYSTREHFKDKRRVAEVYIKGIDLSEKAEGDIIPLKNGETVWRIGAYRTGRRSLPKYTTDRKEAEEYAKTRKK